ncbi:MAG: hypothetical protein IJ576_06380 [Synergistaceae bacterium]|nr:hypothetical protein [Synergistaceae bacterium]
MKKSLFRAVAYLLIFSICFSSPAEAGWLGDAWNWTKKASSSALEATKDGCITAWNWTTNRCRDAGNWIADVWPSLLQYGVMAAAGAKIIWELYKKTAPAIAPATSMINATSIIDGGKIVLLLKIIQMISEICKVIWKYRKPILKVISFGFRVPIPAI